MFLWRLDSTCIKPITMNRYLLLFLLIPFVCDGKEKYRPSKSQIKTVKYWLQTEGIQNSAVDLECNSVSDNTIFRLGLFSIKWSQAIYTNMLCLRTVGSIRNRNITPDSPTLSVNPYGETIAGPVLQKEKGTESIYVIEVPIESTIKYRAIYNKGIENRMVRDTVDIKFRIHYVMNTRTSPYGYLAAIVPRNEKTELLKGRDFLENFIGYVIGLKFDGTLIDIPKEPRGSVPKKTQNGWHGQLRSNLKYTDGHQDWDYVEIYRLTPSGEFGELVSRLK